MNDGAKGNHDARVKTLSLIDLYLLARLGENELRRRRLLAARQLLDGVVTIFFVVRQHAEDEFRIGDAADAADVIARGWHEEERREEKIRWRQVRRGGKRRDKRVE